jgi:hypothetical protein
MKKSDPEFDPDPDPLVRGTDPRMSQIINTGSIVTGSYLWRLVKMYRTYGM